MAALERLYWFTLEYGVVNEDGPRAIGAGLLSSIGELQRMQAGVELRPFEVVAASRTEYDPTDYQPQLFIARSLDAMFAACAEWLDA